MIRARLFPLPILLLVVQPSYPFAKVLPAKLNPEAAAAFDQYAAQSEARLASEAPREPSLRGGDLRIENGAQGREINVPGGMIQDWVGRMFIPGATLAQVRRVLQDYPDYKNFYAPKVIGSKLLAHSGDDYDVLLRLREEHLVTVVFNATYHIQYEAPDPRHLIVISRSTRIAEVKNPDASDSDEYPPGDDSGFLWRLNSYWNFEAADGGVYARCESISLSRDVPLGLGWMLKGFLESLPRESMMNALRGTRAAVDNLKAAATAAY